MPLELGRPVRLQVDFDPPPGIPYARSPWYLSPEAPRVAACLGEGLFFLQLGYPPAAGPGATLFRDAARSAAAGGARVTAVLAPGGHPVSGLAGTGIGEAALDVTTVPPGPRLVSLLHEFTLAAAALPAAPLAGALFRAGRGDLGAIPTLLEACAEARLGFVELPPLPLVYSTPQEASLAVSEAADYRLLAAAVAASPPPPGLQWRAHDILVDAILGHRGGGRPGGFGGCQAAGALAHVSSSGTVFPCAALRIPLGAVSDVCAGGFWERPPAMEVRRKVAAETTDCPGCPALRRCRGACPAVRLAAGGSWEGPDPLCGLYRELLGGPAGEDGQ